MNFEICCCLFLFCEDFLFKIVNRMEETMNEGEAQQSFRSPPRRRRSTFFERRESFVPQPVSENVEPSSSNMTTDVQEKQNSELHRYHDQLLAEKEKWKIEVKDRRNIYHDLRQQYHQMALKSGRLRMSFSTLSNEDIEFIKGKCNISKLVDSQQKLHKSIKETRALYKCACELDDIILSICEDKVNKITEYIIDNSTIESK